MEKYKLSARVESIAESPSLKMSALLSELRSQGEDIISLNVGEPDFSTDPQIIRATQKALEEGHTRYDLVPGQMALRQALAQKLEEDNNLIVGAENILISSGSKQTLYTIFQTLLDPGDEVIVPKPYWVTFPESIRLAGGIPVLVDSLDTHHLDLEKIKKAISAKTKAILINSPNNPSGAVYHKDELLKLSEILKEHNLYLVSDEAYESLVYDQEHLSPASLSQDLFNRTLTVQSFSKSYVMTGFRLGYVAAPKELILGMSKLQGHLTGNCPTFSQQGALRALEISEDIRSNMVQIFKARRDLAFELFSQIFHCQKPQGAFYLFMNISSHLGERFKTCEEFNLFLLKKAKVALLHGGAFGLPNYLRLSYTCSEEEIKEAFSRIKAVL